MYVDYYCYYLYDTLLYNTYYIPADEPKYTDIGITLQHYVKYDLWIVVCRQAFNIFSLVWCYMLCMSFWEHINFAHYDCWVCLIPKYCMHKV